MKKPIDPDKTAFDFTNEENSRIEPTQAIQEGELPPSRTEKTELVPEPKVEIAMPRKPESDQENKAFKWNTLSNATLGTSERISAKDYYNESALLQKFLNPFGIINLVAGLVIGLLLGYWMHGFFNNISQPDMPALVSETVSITPPPGPDEPETTTPTETAPAEATAPSAPVATTPAKPSTATPAATPAIAKKWLKSIKIAATAKQTTVDLDANGLPFQHSAKLLSKPYRLVVTMQGLNGTASKNSVSAPANATPLSKVKIDTVGDSSLRLTMDLKSKSTPKYTVARTKSGLKVTFKK